MFTDQIMKITNGEVNFNNNIELEPWLDKIQENFSTSMASTIVVQLFYSQKPRPPKVNIMSNIMFMLKLILFIKLFKCLYQKKKSNSNVKWAKWENVRFEENFIWPTFK